MNLHLRIEDDASGLIEIQMLAGAAGAYLDCLRASYEEIGGEAYNSRRQRTQHQMTPTAVAEIEALLPNHRLPAPSRISADQHGPAFTLTIGRGAEALEYAWVSAPPSEWAALGRIVRILLGAADVAE